MQIFLDTADVDEIRRFAASGMVDGVTTNPSLVHKSGRDFRTVIEEIAGIVPGPVSAEVVATDADTMVEEGEKLATVAPNVVIKIPLTWPGLEACSRLAGAGHPVNVTLCFSATQALLAAKAGAAFVSPFVGRLDDLGLNGIALIAEIRKIYDNYPFETRILAASVRSPRHVAEVAAVGADAATLPPSTLQQLALHPLTDKGLAAFLADWSKTGQTI